MYTIGVIGQLLCVRICQIPTIPLSPLYNQLHSSVSVTTNQGVVSTQVDTA